MKIPPATLAKIARAIAPLDEPEVRTRYANGDFARSELTKDVDKRYRWDLFWGSLVYQDNAEEFSGYSDAHIDTALRSIVAPLEVSA